MAARAIWKAVVKIGTLTVPVKLYSAVHDRSVHFRLLHKTDKEPVKQQLVSAESGESIEYADVRKAYPLARGRMVVLESEELERIWLMLKVLSRRSRATSRSPASSTPMTSTIAGMNAPTTLVPTRARKLTSPPPPHSRSGGRKASRAGRCAARTTSARCVSKMDT